MGQKKTLIKLSETVNWIKFQQITLVKGRSTIFAVLFYPKDLTNKCNTY